MAGGTDYDNFIMFNPEGKVRQLEYIKRTTSLGNTCLALCNHDTGVLIAHVPRRSKLAEPQEKVFEINKDALFVFSGITNDGLSIVDYLNRAALSESVIKDRPIHYKEVFRSLCLDAAWRTFTDSARLYGVAGILMIDAGHSEAGAETGIKIVEFDPTGIVREAKGVSIGYRSQSCRTILEDFYEKFEDASVEELICIGLKSLANAHPDPEEDTLKADDVYIYVIETGNGHRKEETSKYMH